MPDTSIIEANRQLFDYGAIGLVAFFAICVAIFSTKQWIDRSRELNAEKDKRIDEAKVHMTESASNREAIVGVQRALESNTVAMNTMFSLLRRDA